MKLPYYFIKTERVFHPFKHYSWLLVPLIAVGGLYYPKLGLLLLPIMLTLMLTGFFTGKYWCGNLCPHGSLFDKLVLPLSPNRKIHPFFKSTFLKTAFFLFYMGMFIRRLIKVSALWGSLAFWDKLGFLFAVNYLMPTIIGLMLTLFVNSRAWCRFCPMSTIQQLMYKLGKTTGLNRPTDRKVTVADPNLCHKCGRCARVCPVQLAPYLEFGPGNQFDNEECIRCATCAVNCPAGILSLATGGEAQKLPAAGRGRRRQRIVAKVETVNTLSDDVREYVFRFVDPAEVAYRAGEFLLVKVTDAPEAFRAYSISSANPEKTKVRITVKKAPGGYGTDIIFRRYRAGDTVELEGPLGHELVVNEKVGKVLCLAGGIGITPFVALVPEFLARGEKTAAVQLVYGVNRENEFLYDDYFRSIAGSDERLSYRPVVASPAVGWEGDIGFVTDVIRNMDLADYTVYMCGPKPMVEAARRLLRQKGVAEDKIRAESA